LVEQEAGARTRCQRLDSILLTLTSASALEHGHWRVCGVDAQDVNF
jgi:hypothetical protein